MKANIDAQKEYNNNIEKLREKAKKGLISEDFLKYLEDLGKDGSDIIAGFVNISCFIVVNPLPYNVSTLPL